MRGGPLFVSLMWSVTAARMGQKPDRRIRLSAREDIAILVADYESLNPEVLNINLDLPWKSEATDSETGFKLGALAAGKCSLQVPLNGHRSSVVILHRVP